MMASSRAAVRQGLAKIHCVSETTARQDKDNQDNEEDAHQAHSARPVVATAVSIEPTSTEQQNQHNNEKQHTNQSSYLFGPLNCPCKRPVRKSNQRAGAAASSNYAKQPEHDYDYHN